MMYEKKFLSPKYDSRKSFYKKAFVVMDNDGWTLFSYDTPICRLMPDKRTIVRYWLEDSVTTRRHITDFFYQYAEMVIHKGDYEKMAIVWEPGLDLPGFPDVD